MASLGTLDALQAVSGTEGYSVSGVNWGNSNSGAVNQSWNINYFGQNPLSGQPDATYITANSFSTTATFEMTGSNIAGFFKTWPADLGKVTSLTFNLYYVTLGLTDDTVSLTAEILNSAGTALTLPFTVRAPITGNTSTNVSGTFTLTTEGQNANWGQWRSSTVKFVAVTSASMGTDGGELRVHGFNLGGTYDPVPTQITNLTATNTTTGGRVNLSWSAPTVSGGDTITGYEYRFSANGGSVEPYTNSINDFRAPIGASGNQLYGQSFVAETKTINAVSVNLGRDSLSDENLKVSIRSTKTGTDLVSGVISGGSIVRTSVLSSMTSHTVTFGSPLSVTLGNTYWLVFEKVNVTTSGTVWAVASAGNPYPTGQIQSQGSTPWSGQTDVRFTVNPSNTWSAWTATGSTSTSHAVTGLTDDQEHIFEIRGVTNTGQVGWYSNPIAVTPTLVTLQFATVDHIPGGATYNPVELLDKPPRMHVEYIGPEGTTSSNSSPLTGVLPTGYTTNDLFIAQITSSEDDPAPVHSITTGGVSWTQIGTTQFLDTGSVGIAQSLWYRRAASASETAPIITCPTPLRLGVTISAFRNVDLLVPLDGVSVQEGTNIAALSLQPQSGSITPGTIQSMALSFVSSADVNDLALTENRGFTVRYFDEVL